MARSKVAREEIDAEVPSMPRVVDLYPNAIFAILIALHAAAVDVSDDLSSRGMRTTNKFKIAYL